MKSAKKRTNVARHWATDDEDALRNYCNSNAPNASLPTFPGRTAASVRLHAYRLGLRTPKSVRAWRSNEVKILMNTYPLSGATGCAEKLPHRGCRAIESKARKLGLKFRETNPSVDAATIHTALLEASKKYPNIDAYIAGIVALQLGANINRVMYTARKLGILCSRDNRKWTNEEDLVLCANRMDLHANAAKLQTLGYPRTLNAIAARCHVLGLHKENTDCFTVADISSLMGVSESTVRQWISTGRLADAAVTSLHGACAWRGTEIKKFLMDNINAWSHEKANKRFLVDVLSGAL